MQPGVFKFVLFFYFSNSNKDFNIFRKFEEKEERKTIRPASITPLPRSPSPTDPRLRRRRRSRRERTEEKRTETTKEKSRERSLD